MATPFKKLIMKHVSNVLLLDKLKTLQVNLGNLCNQQCRHCHIKAGPSGNNIMQKATMDKIISFLKNKPNVTLDITGGSPEMNHNFKYFVEKNRQNISRIIVRTNLTIYNEPQYNRLAEWYAENEIVLVASLPCYTQGNVDRQRGRGTFQKSIKVLKNLNSLGYGKNMELNIVYNPGGNFLPSGQSQLESDYKEHLSNYGIFFTKLFTITNAPLGRFREELAGSNNLNDYMNLLKSNFNPATLPDIMCRSMVNVAYDGTLYNCDFNYVAGKPVKNKHGEVLKIDDLDKALNRGIEIETDEHCYCCTAGSGSSCTGALV